MSAANKLQQLAKKLGAATRPRSQAASIVARTSQTTLSATENATVDNASIRLEATPAPDEAERENEATTANQARSLRDIKAKRTKLTPVSQVISRP
jgi:hypothetical protein